MQRHYYTSSGKRETTNAAERLAQMWNLVASHESGEQHLDDKQAGRNLWTRTLDAVFGFIRLHAHPLHRMGLVLSAVVLYLYAGIVAFTARLRASGDASWPNVVAPSVIALWHRDAPTLLVAFAKQAPGARAVILVAGDPRGDCLALLCRMLGLEVVRTSDKHGGWKALSELAVYLKRGGCAIITADGGGPARVAKVGALVLASAAGVPLVPLRADCYPALQQSHKWDAARNPLPFSKLIVWMGAERMFEYFSDAESIERARLWLEETLNESVQ